MPRPHPPLPSCGPRRVSTAVVATGLLAGILLMPMAVTAPPLVSPAGASTPANPAPAPVVTEVVVGTRTVTASWEPPPGVTVSAWSVQIAGPVPSRRTLPAGTTSVTFSGLAPGTPHSLTVTAFPTGVVSRARVPLQTLPIVPAPRIGRVATSETGLVVEFFRPAVRGDVTFVDYLVEAGGQTVVVPAEAGVNRYEATFNDLPRNGTVAVAVTARTDRGVDAVSPAATRNVTLRSPEPPPTARLSPRSGGIGVTVLRARVNGARVPVSGYEVTAGGVTVITGTDGKALLDGLAGNTAYTVQVTTRFGALRGQTAEVGEVTTLPAAAPDPPQNVRVALPTPRQPVFRWDPAPTGTVDRYELYADGRLEVTVDGKATSASMRTSPLLPAPTAFRIVAVNAYGTAATEDMARIRLSGAR